MNTDFGKLRYKVGYTAIELVIAVGIASLIIAATSLFISRGISSNREQFEQVLTTENARKQLKTISDTIRDAQNRSEDDWLTIAEPNQIAVATNIDEDADIETVRYFLDGSELKQGITEPGEGEAVRTIARGAQNNDVSANLFTYTSADGAALGTGQANSSNVERVTISLFVDNNTDQDPGIAQLMVELTSRTETTQVARMWPVSLNFPENPESWGATDGPVDVTVTNPETSEQTTYSTTIADINDGRMETYSGGYYVNLNYQSQTTGSDLPGWYAWVGPILTGAKNGVAGEKIDKLSQAGLCLGQNMPGLVSSCARRWVGDCIGCAVGAEPETYKTYLPVILFRQPGGQLDYVRDVSYGIQQAASPTPTPTASSSCYVEVIEPEDQSVKPYGYSWYLDAYYVGGTPAELKYYANGQLIGTTQDGLPEGWVVSASNGKAPPGNVSPGNYTVIAYINGSPGQSLGPGSCASEPITFTVLPEQGAQDFCALGDPGPQYIQGTQNRTEGQSWAMRVDDRSSPRVDSVNIFIDGVLLGEATKKWENEVYTRWVYEEPIATGLGGQAHSMTAIGVVGEGSGEDTYCSGGPTIMSIRALSSPAPTPTPSTELLLCKFSQFIGAKAGSDVIGDHTSWKWKFNFTTHNADSCLAQDYNGFVFQDAATLSPVSSSVLPGSSGGTAYRYEWTTPEYYRQDKNALFYFRCDCTQGALNANGGPQTAVQAQCDGKNSWNCTPLIN